MTLDDIAARMRERFVESQGQPVLITAEEWNAMAQGIYVADALEAVLVEPANEGVRNGATARLRLARGR